MKRTITPEQWRAARAMTGRSQDQIAAETGLTAQTLINLESGRSPGRPGTLEKLEDTYHHHGIVFTASGVERIVERETEILYVGTADDGGRVSAEHAAEAIEILNTHGHPHYGSVYSSKTGAIVRDALRRDVVREDCSRHVDVICQVTETFSERVHTAFRGIDYREKYQCFKLKNPALMGLMDFEILIFAPPRPAEVFFGFASLLGSQKGDTFLTRHPKMVEFFTHLHEKLRSPELSQIIDPLMEKPFDDPFPEMPTASPGDLLEILGEIAKTYKGKRIERLRLTVNGGIYFLPTFESSGLQVDVCDLAIRFRMKNKKVEERKAYQDEVRSLVARWQNLATGKRVMTLRMKRHDAFIPDWHIIVDERYVIVGLLYPKPDDYRGFDESKGNICYLIRATQRGGSEIIRRYINRFDTWFGESDSLPDALFSKTAAS